jgi:hypothetical protein
MTDTRGLLNRIAAFRERLENTPQLGPTTMPAVAAALSPVPNVTSSVATAAPTSPTLTSRARRLLGEARELIDHQRRLSADALLAKAESETDPLVCYHRGTVGLTDSAVRLVQTFPVAAEAQLRACDGLEQLLRTVRDRLTVLEHAAAAKRVDCDRMERLAGLLTALNAGQPVALEPFADLAEKLIDEARRGGRIRILTAEVSGSDAWAAAKCVAAHALTVAQVVARVAHLDYEWAGRPHVPVVAALLMDVGMLRVPPSVFAKAGPLTLEERRAVDAHPRIGAELVRRLIPDAAVLAEVILAHHERLDGTGYPAAARGDALPPMGRFLAACDAYAAMIADRPHRPAMDPRTALTDCLLMAEQGLFDRDFAEYLLALGFHPVGTVVELTDGRLAVVAANHTGPVNLRAVNRPVVAILSDTDGRIQPRPEFVDLAMSERGGIVRALSTTERRAKLADSYPDLCG